MEEALEMLLDGESEHRKDGEQPARAARPRASPGSLDGDRGESEEDERHRCSHEQRPEREVAVAGTGEDAGPTFRIPAWEYQVPGTMYWD